LDELQTGPFGSSLHQSDYVPGGTPVINPASLQDGRIIPIEKMAVGPVALERLSSFKLCPGDIVMARRGEMGRCALVSDAEAGWLCGTGSLILRPSTIIYGPFLVLLIGSPTSRKYLSGTAVGTTMQNLNQSILTNLPFGLPPLAEQHRIVAKVDELMALCDSLEASIGNADDTRSRLLSALLHDAVSDPAIPREWADSPEMEAT
ncbi:MAG: restriction endonuclease subunit S, partial [Rhodospirillaceae bacterium]